MNNNHFFYFFGRPQCFYESVNWPVHQLQNVGLPCVKRTYSVLILPACQGTMVGRTERNGVKFCDFVTDLVFCSKRSNWPYYNT